MKRVGIDLDGVVANFIEGYYEAARRIFPGIVWDLTQWTVWEAPREIWGLSNEQNDAVWEEIKKTPDFWLNLRPLPGTHQLRLIPENKGEIFFITSRIPTVGRSIQAQSCRFLRKEFHISFPQVIVVMEPSDKIPLVKALHLDAFIDDKDSTVKQMANAGINVYANTQPWNAGELPGKRVKDLNEFLAQEGFTYGR